MVSKMRRQRKLWRRHRGDSFLVSLRDVEVSSKFSSGNERISDVVEQKKKSVPFLRLAPNCFTRKNVSVLLPSVPLVSCFICVCVGIAPSRDESADVVLEPTN